MADLGGRTIAFLEARRANELSDLIVRHRGRPLAAPCLREVHRPDAPELIDVVDRLCQGAIEVVIWLTGVGTATILDCARLQGREAELLAALRAMQLVARGPKPLAVLRRAGLTPALVAPPPHTTVALLAALAAWPLAGREVAVQLYGGPADEFLAALSARGATVVTLSPYVWQPPAEAAPVERLIEQLLAGRVDALLTTSAAQIDMLFAIAEQRGQATTLHHALAAIPLAAQGSVSAAALERIGLQAAILPPTGHMGALVLAVAAYFQSPPAAAVSPPAAAVSPPAAAVSRPGVASV